ncbi:MAG: type II toxin-antitoxin system PemK/MazF family toxin [Syntrophus sp. (in: bacteria)]|nr:type II toxin-antitoxin system PemK/MazF family toxin [Syntrophus sp. (in: bacteria)]
MTTMERGMIIDIDPDPVPGAEAGKVRPCVVVTNDVYNARVPVMQVVPITAWNERSKSEGIVNPSPIPTCRELIPSAIFLRLTMLCDYGHRTMSILKSGESEYDDFV